MWRKAHHRNLKRAFEDLLPCYCYATKTNSIKIRSQVWPRKEADTNELLHDTRAVEMALVQCECHTANKLSLQKLNQLIGTGLLTSCFLENFGS